MGIEFEEKQNGLKIIDSIERCQCFLLTRNYPKVNYYDTSELLYPADSAVETTAKKIVLSSNQIVYVRRGDGSMITDVHPKEKISLPKDLYILDISNSMKIYTYIKSEVNIYSEKGKTCIDLNSPTRVIIGVRSFHTRPAETITTTSDPTDVMQAISVFGSALKTTKPERSYPTLRGHPPVIELGDRLEIPEGIEHPDTGVSIGVPPSLRDIFIISPLAYYLGAKLTPSLDPEITTTTGYSFDLDKKDGYQTVVNQTLRQVVFLDCIVRTEGISPSPLQERHAIESVLNFDVESIYNQTLAERLEAYLRVPFSTVQPYLPKWRLKSELEPTVESIPFIPYIANDLTAISVKDKNIHQMGQVGDRFHVSTSGRDDQPLIKQCWTCDDLSKIVGTTPLSAFYNTFNQTPRDESIKIDIICNDPAMSEELVAVYGTYGNREELPFEVTIHHELTVDELKSLLGRPTDFVHYIGHIDSDGFRCSDGELNAKSIKTVQARSFLLNACQSLNQGLDLINSGSIGGIVTLEDVANRDAVRIGSLIAHLLNYGFPLYGVIDIVRQENTSGGKYQIVGDGTFTVVQSDFVPVSCSITKEDDRKEMKLELSTKDNVGVGGIYRPHISAIDEYQLLPSEIGPISVTKPQLVDFLDVEDFPVFLDGSLHMSSDVSLQDL